MTRALGRFLLIAIVTLSASTATIAQSDRDLVREQRFSAPSDFEELRSAQNLLGRGNVRGAIAALESLQQRFGGEPDVHRLLGHAYYLDRQLEKAKASFGRALALGPFTGDVVNRLVKIARSERRDPPLSLLRIAALINPDDTTLQLLFAQSLAKRNRPGEARSVYLDALRTQPDLPVAHFGLAQIYLAEDADHQAIVHFVTAWALASDDLRRSSLFAVARNTAELLVGRGDLPGAAHWIEEAIAYAPSDEVRTLRVRRAEIAWAAGQGDDADHIATALAHDPATPPTVRTRASMLRGYIAHAAGNDTLALEQWSDALQHGADDPRLRLHVAQLWRSSDPQRAIDTLIQGQNPNPERHADLLAELSIEVGNNAEARRRLVQHVAENGWDARAREIARRLNAIR